MLQNLILSVPEIFVLIMAIIILMAGLFLSKYPNFPYYLAQVTLIIAAGITCYISASIHVTGALFTFGNSFIFDRLSILLKLFVYISVFFTFIYSRQYNLDRKIRPLEFYVLGLLSTLGMMILISAYHLLTLFLGLELLALPTYAMVAMQRRKTLAVEAAMKYFVIGTLASGLLLYGLSMIFGATKSLDMIAIAHIIQGTSFHLSLIFVFGLVFIIAGVAFKLGVAPFHMWVPDVYDGAPTSVTLFISTALKVAAYALVIRLLVNTLPALHVQWQAVLIVVAILSMGVGNVAAIIQTNIKRMLAYSSIAHMGYMLLGVLCATPRGYAAALFYTIAYSIMTLAAFGMVALLSHAGEEAENIHDFVGLNNRNPWLAFVMLLTLFSLAGVPPLVGFIAKVGVLEALIQVHLVWLAVVAVLFAIVGAYYYIRVVKAMYFESGPTREPVVYSLEMKIAISVNGILVLMIGVFPGWLFSLSQWVF